MEFIKRMKKREFIEMGLKTAIAILLGIIVIFAMEAMIYNIHIKAIKKVDTAYSNPKTVEYYIEKVNSDSYNVYEHDPSYSGLNWRVSKKVSKANLDAMCYTGGEMHTFDATLYKIEAIKDTVTTTFENDATTGDTPSEKLEESLGDNTEGYIFNVYTKASADGEYKLTYIYNDYASYYKAFHDTPGVIGKLSAKQVHWRAPNCFDIYMNWVHYLLMVVFLMIIAGFYAWRFTLITKEYKKIERKFKKTGKIFN